MNAVRMFPFSAVLRRRHQMSLFACTVPLSRDCRRQEVHYKAPPAAEASAGRSELFLTTHPAYSCFQSVLEMLPSEVTFCGELAKALRFVFAKEGQLC